MFRPSGAHTRRLDNCATPYLPPGVLQSRWPLGSMSLRPAPGPLAQAKKFWDTPPMMNLGMRVANRVSIHQPSPPSMVV